MFDCCNVSYSYRRVSVVSVLCVRSAWRMQSFPACWHRQRASRFRRSGRRDEIKTQRHALQCERPWCHQSNSTHQLSTCTLWQFICSAVVICRIAGKFTILRCVLQLCIGQSLELPQRWWGGRRKGRCFHRSVYFWDSRLWFWTVLKLFSFQQKFVTCVFEEVNWVIVMLESHLSLGVFSDITCISYRFVLPVIRNQLSPKFQRENWPVPSIHTFN